MRTRRYTQHSENMNKEHNHMRTERSHLNDEPTTTCRDAHTHGRNFGARARGAWRNQDGETTERRARRTHRDGRRHGNGNQAAFMAGRGFGEHARESHTPDRPRGASAIGRGGRGQLRGIVADLQMQVEDLKRKMRRLHHAARSQAATPAGQVETHTTSRRVIRTTRTATTGKHYSRHGHELGRKMGRMTQRGWQDSQTEA